MKKFHIPNGKPPVAMVLTSGHRHRSRNAEAFDPPSLHYVATVLPASPLTSCLRRRRTRPTEVAGYEMVRSSERL